MVSPTIAKLKSLSDQEICRLLMDKSVLSNLRKVLSHGMGQIEQENAQWKMLTSIDLRRQEFRLALEIAECLGVDLSKDLEILVETSEADESNDSSS